MSTLYTIRQRYLYLIIILGYLITVAFNINISGDSLRSSTSSTLTHSSARVNGNWVSFSWRRVNDRLRIRKNTRIAWKPHKYSHDARLHSFWFEYQKQTLRISSDAPGIQFWQPLYYTIIIILCKCWKWKQYSMCKCRHYFCSQVLSRPASRLGELRPALREPRHLPGAWSSLTGHAWHTVHGQASLDMHDIQCT